MVALCLGRTRGVPGRRAVVLREAVRVRMLSRVAAPAALRTAPPWVETVAFGAGSRTSSVHPRSHAQPNRRTSRSPSYKIGTRPSSRTSHHRRALRTDPPWAQVWA
eukprot:scaffold17728_cov62-Phaeocystis_antarctica.AAC.4